MPLTPADVHNVAFSKPPIGKRGYNEDEVDAFLDLVENELTRLVEENADLRQRVNELDQEIASARAGAGASPQAAQSIPLYEPDPDPVKPA
ncbi:MAG: DivIVA domain-containing protein, partial [Mycobacterium sp.]